MLQVLAHELHVFIQILSKFFDRISREWAKENAS